MATVSALNSAVQGWWPICPARLVENRSPDTELKYTCTTIQLGFSAGCALGSLNPISRFNWVSYGPYNRGFNRETLTVIFVAVVEKKPLDGMGGSFLDMRSRKGEPLMWRPASVMDTLKSPKSCSM
jgi:hypothetical protein